MPAKKVAKTPEPQPVSAGVPKSGLSDNAFVRSYLWPTALGLAAAILSALTANLPAILSDGIQEGDWFKLLGIVAAAGLGYLTTVLTRYGGKGAPWTSPPV